jgi:hypothetical protein
MKEKLKISQKYEFIFHKTYYFAGGDTTQRGRFLSSSVERTAPTFRVASGNRRQLLL